MTDPQRRHFARASFSADATLLVADVAAPCTVHDLSLKGALVSRDDASPAPQAGSECVLVIALDGEEAAIRLDCEVAHAEGNRVGLVWRETDLDSLTHLRRLLELNLADPQLMQRELGALLAASGNDAH